jgi:serine/threonine-protein kinase
VLGALAIIIAVLIVINSRRDHPTVTDNGPPPTSTTPTGSGPGPGLRLDWTDRSEAGNSDLHSSRAIEPSGIVPLTPYDHVSLARYETLQ